MRSETRADKLVCLSSGMRSKEGPQAGTGPWNGAPDTIRTCGLHLRRPKSRLRQDSYLHATLSSFSISEFPPFPFETYRAHFLKNGSW